MSEENVLSTNVIAIDLASAITDALTPKPTPTPTTEPTALTVVVESPNPQLLRKPTPASKRRRVHTCSLCGQIRSGHVCPKKTADTCILDCGVTNTPVFGMSIKKVLCNKINRLGAEYNRKLVRTAKIMQFIAGVGGKLSLYKVSGAWGWCRGFLLDIDVWIVSATLSIQFSHLANDFGWGVDSSQFWCRPIYFMNNLETDGKQWVRQVLRVFPQDAERINWCMQYYIRTHTLQGGPKDKGRKLCYRRPSCACCGVKTKCFHVLQLEFQCKECVNRRRVQNLLITHNQVLQQFKHVTRISLRTLPCIRIQSAELWKPSRYYLQSSVKKLSNKIANDRLNVTFAKSYSRGLGNCTDINTNDVKPRRMKKIMQAASAVAPMNSAAALSITRDPVPDRVEKCRIIPKALAAITDSRKGRRGPVAKRPQGNFGKVQVRIVGLDGCTVKTRVFDTPLERKTYRQMQRRKVYVHIHIYIHTYTQYTHTHTTGCDETNDGNAQGSDETNG